MRFSNHTLRSLARLRRRLANEQPSSRIQAQLHPKQLRHGLFTRTRPRQSRKSSRSTLPLAVISGGLFVWWLYPSDDFAQLSNHSERPYGSRHKDQDGDRGQAGEVGDSDRDGDQSAWTNFASRFESVSLVTDLEWSALSDALADYILPDWSKLVPGYLRKLQRELSMSPGSLADEVWHEAHDPLVNPEIRYSAKVRVSSELCNEEKEYLSRRRRVIRIALARYLGLKEEDIHPDDVPTIAMCGSGGGLRALIAGSGSMLATEEDGLFDCVTYTAGVSGSCWLQTFYLSSLAGGRIDALIDHLKARASTHIAYPPVAFHALSSLPTSKYLLSGIVEKLKGDPKADFGLVDVYGLLLAARYLIPKGDLAVNEHDFKFSHQREYIKYGQHPLPIYTAVRHEIPGLQTTQDPERLKELAKQESWFQWFELTPYEFFCEEFGAGIPTWALGRRFKDGKDVPPEHGFHLPEIRVPLLLGIFGSAFCATLKHYYQEIQPLVRSVGGFGAIDDMISDKSDDLGKVHPIDPAKIPNFAYQMQGKLAKTTPESIYQDDYIQLMDAGMSNNLPIYPLLRPGRDVDVIITFDASADVKTDNWLSVADGYARQRGIKGWPVGIGWPKPTESPADARRELEEAQAESAREADVKLREARKEQEQHHSESSKEVHTSTSPHTNGQLNKDHAEIDDLGYCTVWVGTRQERSSEPPPPSKVVSSPDTWRLMDPDAGITVVYLPLMANEKVPNVSPKTSDFLSTWNFVYTPEQIDKVVELARANYDEGKDQIRSTIRAVYERKKKLREKAEKQSWHQKHPLLRQGDQFS